MQHPRMAGSRRSAAALETKECMQGRSTKQAHAAGERAKTVCAVPACRLVLPVPAGGAGRDAVCRRPAGCGGSQQLPPLCWGAAACSGAGPRGSSSGAGRVVVRALVPQSKIGGPVWSRDGHAVWGAAGTMRRRWTPA